MLTPTLTLYVMGAALRGVAVSALVLLSVVWLLDFVELTRAIGARIEVSFWSLAYLSLLHAPALAVRVCPFIVLFGMMGALHQLNRRSELIVMRAAGVSAWRFLGPSLLTAAVVGALAAALLDPLAARLQAHYEVVRARLVAPTQTSAPPRVWLREVATDRQAVISGVRANDDPNALVDATILVSLRTPEGDLTFDRRFDADRAVMENGYWRLLAVRETLASGATRQRDQMIETTVLTRAEFADPTPPADALSFWALRGAAERTRRAGYAAQRYVLKWHRLAALPVTLAAMAALAASVSIRTIRSGGTARLVGWGVCAGFGVYFFDSVLSALGASGVLPAPLPAWLTPQGALLPGLGAFAVVEDG
ncbi:MAG: LptF/LptG family permease [Maricaulaceae bacterium]